MADEYHRLYAVIYGKTRADRTWKYFDHLHWAKHFIETEQPDGKLMYCTQSPWQPVDTTFDWCSRYIMFVLATTGLRLYHPQAICNLEEAMGIEIRVRGDYDVYGIDPAGNLTHLVHVADDGYNYFPWTVNGCHEVTEWHKSVHAKYGSDQC